MTNNPADLLTDEACSAGEAALGCYPIHEADMLDAASDVLLAAAPLVVAAELRRLADELAATAREWRETRSLVRAHTMEQAVRRLRDRADELDPTGAGRADA